jgi:hypothetical protein
VVAHAYEQRVVCGSFERREIALRRCTGLVIFVSSASERSRRRQLATATSPCSCFVPAPDADALDDRGDRP